MDERLTRPAALLTVAGAVIVGSYLLLRGTPVPAWAAVVLLAVAAAACVAAWHDRARIRTDRATQESQRQLATRVSLATVEALACAIDARARSLRSIVRREQAYAVALARSFGLSPQETDGVRMAALLHDIGKLAVPDHILAKRGPLTPEEASKVRVHTQVGADILAHVPFQYPVASLVLCHHERWDGTGYPAGLHGHAIPLGARILSVVDHFEALTSERPFRGALSQDEAVKLLWREAGTALDPMVVARFVDLLPALRDAEMQGGTAPMPASAPDGTPSGRALPADASVSAFDEIALANKEIYALYDIAQAMGTSLGVADSMSVIADKLRDLVPFAGCALFQHDPATGAARCRFATGTGATGLRPLVLRAGSGLVGGVIASRACEVNGDPAEDFPRSMAAADTGGLAAALVCPLVAGDSAIGALALYHTEPGFFTAEHHRLALRVTEQAAAVIHNSIVFEQTREESVTDPLTGLPNSRFLFPHLTRELARARRTGTGVAVLLLDLDNLKQINDTFGHSTGDRALREVASVMRRAIRPYDTVVRYGGDEFIVLLADCDVDNAEAKRVELQQVVGAMPFLVRGTQRVRLSISVGAAVFPHDGDSCEALLSAADSRMYRDKGERKGASPTQARISGDGPSELLADFELQRAAAGIL